MRVLITGAAGFIGFHLSKKLIKEGFDVFGLDNLNNYYDPNLKKSRIIELKKISENFPNQFIFIEGDLIDKSLLNNFFQTYKPNYIVNLAAQAGVRYSFDNPESYINSNLVGFANLLELCRQNKTEHFVYASSSSVYGGNTNFPYSEKNSVNHPVSLYAATKKANEIMAHSYSHLFNIPSTGLRFFTVYGPWGRPDMALFKFTKSIIEGEEIEVFNNGNMIRDFTYIDDITESLFKILKKPATINPDFITNEPDPSTSWAPHRLFNIGNSNPIKLMDYISEIEKKLGIVAKKKFLPMQPGDVMSTSADTTLLESWIDYKPNTPIKKGISLFIDWYKDYYS
tara:strand:+ start:503 stop:1522 length:1020 start_codon:yes stop_codon:yes gene_type:complete